MSFALSRLMSAATASYAVYALAEPRHLGRALFDDEKQQAAYDDVAQTYGVRDLAVSSVALLSKRPGAVRAAMATRILLDVGDGLLLATKAPDHETRQKVLGVTFGWAALNLLAVRIDSRRAKKKE
jgi:hypothetical protein